jgi:ATP-dependent RNA helicase DeaD
VQTFKSLGLASDLLQSIEELGFSSPTPIQVQTIPLLLEGPTDLIGLAATGTGKTAAFSLPLLEGIDPKLRAVQGLVLCPTRELALQVAGQIDLLGKHKNVWALPIYGGASYTPQIKGLASGAMIVVGTPGRVVDHLNRGTLKLDHVQTLVLDEADEMISMGFKEELENILKMIPKDQSKIWLFSATMSKEVRRVADTYLRSPKQVQVNRTEMLSTTVEQVFFRTREKDKPEILCKLIEAADDFYGIVFCQTKELVKNLTQYMLERGYKVDCLHGDKDQNSREKTMQAFRTKKVNILVCTDVASRGIDVKDITHVLNYSLPRELDLYVHRIGRTARSGKSGIAMSLVSPSHLHLISRIEKMTKSRMTEGRIPSRKEIGTKRLQKILPLFTEERFHPRVKDLMTPTWTTVLEDMSKEEIASRFIAMIAGDLFQDREEVKTLESAPEEAPRSEQRRSPRHRGRPFRGQERFGGDRQSRSGRSSRRG